MRPDSSEGMTGPRRRRQRSRVETVWRPAPDVPSGRRLRDASRGPSCSAHFQSGNVMNRIGLRTSVALAMVSALSLLVAGCSSLPGRRIALRMHPSARVLDLTDLRRYADEPASTFRQYPAPGRAAGAAHLSCAIRWRGRRRLWRRCAHRLDRGRHASLVLDRIGCEHRRADRAIRVPRSRP